ncbi:hypothetical protein [Streptomyces thermodiastaticus]|uniref:hypothetical protein n=1 Tax=Streptomyces thermodiastaticus TaxID=44061 RepID=UPI00167A0A6E|nr:hypothetical protein [Streptomyces thermodiastaticus]MCE7552243.1 hypothetical protein [Streptomyces thermodiastaticus]
MTANLPESPAAPASAFARGTARRPARHRPVTPAVVRTVVRTAQNAARRTRVIPDDARSAA